MVKKGYKQTEIGVIPEDWAIGYLSDFGKVQSGGTPSTTMADYWGGSIAWCTPSDITSTPTKYINSTERTITDTQRKRLSALIVSMSMLRTKMDISLPKRFILQKLRLKIYRNGMCTAGTTSVSDICPPRVSWI